MDKEHFLAMSLPYELKMYMEDLKGNIEIPFKLRPEWLEDVLEFGNKPILHPPSDLTKEIEHKGKRFVPIRMLSNYAKEQTEDGKNGLEWGIISTFPFLDILNLIEWHFDIIGLIEKNEAIDVNTLSENPYK